MKPLLPLLGCMLQRMSPAFILLALAASPAITAAPGIQIGLGSAVDLPVPYRAIATDPAGSIYTLGVGTVPGIPPTTTLGPPSETSSFLLKLSPSGTPVYLTYLGIPAGALAVDAAGNAYLAAYPGNLTYIMKLNPTGTQILYRAALGSQPAVRSLVLDARGGLHFGGQAAGGVLPTTPIAFQTSATSGKDHPFAGKLLPDGSIAYLTYVTGSLGGTFVGIGADASGTAILHGLTNSPDFPTTPGVYRNLPARNPGFPEYDSDFLAKLKPDGTGLLYSTYTGTGVYPSSFGGRAFAVDSTGAAIFVQQFEQEDYRAIQILRFHPDGTSATLLKRIQPLFTWGFAFVLDSQDRLYLSGSTDYNINLPLRNNIATCDESRRGLMILAPSGETLLSSYLPPGSGGVLPIPGTDSVYLFRRGRTLQLVRTTSPASVSPVTLACAGNAASLFPGPLAPGEVISLFGEGLGPAEGFATQPEGIVYPTESAGVRVTVSGQPAPLLYVQHSQINTVVPWSLTGPSAELCVSIGSAAPNCLTMRVEESNPGVFTTEDRYAIAWNANGTRNSATNPAAYGELVTILATGLGPLDPTPADGVVLNSPMPAFRLPAFVFHRLGIVIGGSYVPTPVRSVTPLPNAIAGIAQVRVAPSDQLRFLGTANSPSSNFFRIHVKP